MSVTKTIAYNKSLRLLFTLVLTVIMVNGCTSLYPTKRDALYAERSEIVDDKALEDAIETYDDTEFEQALRQFVELGHTTKNEHVKRKARLGEICSRLMLAETQGEFITAVDMWRRFAKDIPAEHDSAWAIPLIDPLIVRMAPKVTTHIVEIKPPPENQNRESPDGVKPQPEKQDEIGTAPTTKKMIEKNEAELKNQVESLKLENQQLKEKIKALEAIDQKIQKKKTKLSAPSE